MITRFIILMVVGLSIAYLGHNYSVIKWFGFLLAGLIPIEFASVYIDSMIEIWFFKINKWFKS